MAQDSNDLEAKPVSLAQSAKSATEMPADSAPTRAPFAAGEIIGGVYQVVCVLGQGGMGCVYKVEQVHLQQQYALKSLNAKFNDSSARRFQKEAQAISSLQHPNIVRAHYFGLTSDEEPFFVMDLIEGKTLESHLKDVGTLSLEETKEIFGPICMALDYAHEQGVVHRDVSPSNIILTKPDGEYGLMVPKIVDFGIARFVDDAQANVTRTGEVFGTPLYMSPEQGLGKRVDRRSDIYSLGCVLFHALTGAPPFAAENALSILLQHQSEEAPTLRQASLGKNFPASLELVVSRAMAKDPNLRYQTCADLCRELNLALVEDAMETEKPAPSPRWDGSKFKDWRAAIALSLLLIGAIVAFAVVNRTEQKGQSESEPRFPQTNQQEGSSFAGQNQGVESADTGTASGFGKGNWKNAKVGKNSLSSTALLKPGSEAPDASDKSPTRHTTDETGKEELGLSPMLRLGAVNYSVVKGKDRVFHFPGDVSLGDIRAVYGPKSWSEFIEARGTVTFPADDALELRLSPRVLYECPNLLRRLKEDDIRLLSVKSTRGGWFYMENTGNGTCDDAFLNVAHLKQLVYINLTSQPITDKAIKNLALDQMPQLRYLILSKTGVTAQCIASIKVLRNLETLAMSKIGHVSPVVAALKGSTKIADLDLSKGDLDDDDLKVITTMPNIEVLSISGSKSVTTKGLTLLGSLRNLTDLNVEGCNVSPLACTLFEELPKLKKLTLTGTIFTSQERAAMRKRMPNCKLDFMAAN